MQKRGRRCFAKTLLRSHNEKRIVGGALSLLFCAIATWPQSTTTAEPQFDVISIKENISHSGFSSMSSEEPGRFVATDTPLRFLILYAFQLLDHQLIGAPAWTSDSTFDVVGTYPSERRQPTEDEIRAMVRKALADRLGLKVHQERREFRVLRLVLARKDRSLGPQLKPSNIDCNQWIVEKRPRIDAGGDSSVSPSGKRPACMTIATRTFLTGGTRTMTDLAKTLQSLVSRPVVDETGLNGAFNIDLQWSSLSLSASAAPDPESPPDTGTSIFAALNEQLGLKLVPSERMVDVVVIDAINRPTPN